MTVADTVEISMTWAQWKFIDATIDNTGSIAAVDLDTEVAEPDGRHTAHWLGSD